MEACSRVSESGWHTTCVEPGRLLISDDDSERTAGTSPPVQGLIEQSGAGSGQYADRSTCAEAAAGMSADTASVAIAYLNPLPTEVPPDVASCEASEYRWGLEEQQHNEDHDRHDDADGD